MKKTFAFTLGLALLLPVLAGCQSTPIATPNHTTGIPQPTQTTPAALTSPAVTQPVASTPAENQLTRDQAIDIALKDAGLTRDQVQDLDAELDRGAGTLHYDVDFEAAGYDYEYDIHANTGKILHSEKEKD